MNHGTTLCELNSMGGTCSIAVFHQVLTVRSHFMFNSSPITSGQNVFSPEFCCVAGGLHHYFSKYSPLIPRPDEKIIQTAVEGTKRFLGPEGKILNMYIWGSRWYLNHIETSDWDFVAIVTDYAQPDTSNVITVADHIDVALCEVNYFAQLLKDHVPWAVAFAYYPSFGIIFENYRLEYKMMLRKQKRALTINTQVNLNQAAALWRHGHIYKARKRVFFVLQMTIFATQLATMGMIYDFWEEPNKLRPLLFDPELDSWKKFAAAWQPIKNSLVERFIYVRNAYRCIEPNIIQSRIDQIPFDLTRIQPFFNKAIFEWDSFYQTLPSDSDRLNALRQHYNTYCLSGPPLVSEYIRHFGIERLKSELAITVTDHPKYPNLKHLTNTRGLSPVDSIVAAECDGIILDGSNNWQVAAFGHHMIANTDDSLASVDQDFKNGKVKCFPYPDGHQITLFHYDNAWQVCTTQSPDGCIGEDLMEDGKTTICQLFWDIWQSTGCNVEGLDSNLCYSFFFMHPNARRRIFYPDPQIIFDGACKWSDSLQNFDLSTISSTSRGIELKLICKTLEQIDPISPQRAGTDDIPFGGFMLQQENCKNRRWHIPDEYMTRLETIINKDGDLFSQELEMVRMLSAYSAIPSVWEFPLPQYRQIFANVAAQMKELIEGVKKHQSTIMAMDKKELSAWAASLGWIQYFLLLFRDANPSFVTVEEFLKRGDRKRLPKMLFKWWTINFSTVPKADLQYSYKS